MGVVSVAGWIALPNRDTPASGVFPLSRGFQSSLLLPVQGGFTLL